MKEKRRESRPNGRETKIIKQFMISRLLEKEKELICEICRKQKDETELIIEHKNNDHTDWDPDNLQLACQPCNISKNPPKLLQRMQVNIDGFAGRSGGGGRRELYKKMVEVWGISNVGMMKNFFAEDAFIGWLDKEMKKRHSIPKDEVIYDGANIAGVQAKQTREYLKKMLFRTGPYRERTEEGIIYIEWKKKDFPFNELMKKFTK